MSQTSSSNDVEQAQSKATANADAAQLPKEQQSLLRDLHSISLMCLLVDFSFKGTSKRVNPRSLSLKLLDVAFTQVNNLLG